jgi:hypothetical protein
MDIRLISLLPTLLLLTNAAILLVFLTGMMQQHGFSSVEEEETENNNNPPGFKSIKIFDSNGKFITSWGSEGMVMVNFGFHTTLLLILQITCM